MWVALNQSDEGLKSKGCGFPEKETAASLPTLQLSDSPALTVVSANSLYICACVCIPVGSASQENPD